MARSVESVYAKALCDAYRDERALEKGLSEGELLRTALSSDHEILSLLKDPKISEEEKKQALDKSLGDALSPEMTAFLSVIVEKKRAAFLPEILNRFREDAMERLRIADVVVTSAGTLTEEQKQRIEAKIRENAPYKTLVFRYETDPSLIGGVKIRIGDRTVDGTVKNRLSLLRRELLNARVDD